MGASVIHFLQSVAFAECVEAADFFAVIDLCEVSAVLLKGEGRLLSDDDFSILVFPFFFRNFFAEGIIDVQLRGISVCLLQRYDHGEPVAVAEVHGFYVPVSIILVENVITDAPILIVVVGELSAVCEEVVDLFSAPFYRVYGVVRNIPEYFDLALAHQRRVGEVEGIFHVVIDAPNTVVPHEKPAGILSDGLCVVEDIFRIGVDPGNVLKFAVGGQIQRQGVLMETDGGFGRFLSGFGRCRTHNGDPGHAGKNNDNCKQYSDNGASNGDPLLFCHGSDFLLHSMVSTIISLSYWKTIPFYYRFFLCGK